MTKRSDKNLTNEQFWASISQELHKIKFLNIINFGIITSIRESGFSKMKIIKIIENHVWKK